MARYKFEQYEDTDNLSEFIEELQDELTDIDCRDEDIEEGFEIEEPVYELIGHIVDKNNDLGRDYDLQFVPLNKQKSSTELFLEAGYAQLRDTEIFESILKFEVIEKFEVEEYDKEELRMYIEGLYTTLEPSLIKALNQLCIEKGWLDD